MFWVILAGELIIVQILGFPYFQRILIQIYIFSRLLLYRTRNTLECASRLSIGDLVHVELPNGRIIPGHLRWVGRTPLAKHGQFFGIEVVSYI